MSNTCASEVEREVVARLEAADEQVERIRRELDHCHRLATLGTMTAGIAHELNNVLTPALGYAQLLQGEMADDPRLLRAASRCAEAIESASRILRSVLELSTTAPAERVADVNGAIRKALDCLGRDPARDGIALRIDVPPGTSAAIEPHALQQVFLNLLLNAVRAVAGRGEGGEITLSARAPGNGRVRLAVSDDGPGIPESVRGRIFEPFVTEPVGGRRTGGTGLGLAICRRTIEERGGTIALAAAGPRGGASFVIELPIASDTRNKAA